MLMTFYSSIQNLRCSLWFKRCHHRTVYKHVAPKFIGSI